MCLGQFATREREQGHRTRKGRENKKKGQRMGGELGDRTANGRRIRRQNREREGGIRRQRRHDMLLPRSRIPLSSPGFRYKKKSFFPRTAI